MAKQKESTKMAEPMVRCPYCVVGDHFQRMLPRPRGWFICLRCGHTANPEKPELECFCQKCGELKRAA
jgi:DNA-directed RNA polymerase subunit RPC12/RpoP